MELKPGSPEAIEAGCKCPVIDNRHGEGVEYPNPTPWQPGTTKSYWINEKCPIHGSLYPWLFKGGNCDDKS